VSLEEWALIASVVFTGLFSGLYAMLNLIFHKVMGAMDGPEFAQFLRRFLTLARKSPFNYIVVIGMVVAPAAALIATDDAGGTPFILTAIGLACTLGGNAVVSNRIARAELRPDARLGSRSHARGLGGGTAVLLQAQLDPRALHLGGIRSLSRRTRGSPLGAGSTEPSTRWLANQRVPLRRLEV
jgi:hypothetical protein